MSGDLEDFLRRAAQRRQAKAAQEKQQQTPPRQRPQYSDRRSERVVQPAEEILEAEVVEEDPNSFASRMRRVEEAKAAAQKVQADIAKKQQAGRRVKSGRSGAAVALSDNRAQNLISLLRKPGGIQTAILLREVLDRPTHRW